MNVIDTIYPRIKVSEKTCKLASKVIHRIFQSKDKEVSNDTSADNTDNTNTDNTKGTLF